MCDETANTLITNLPQILTAAGVVITAVGSILAAYWSYRARQNSQTTAVGMAILSSRK
jgi:hypothetical protein